MEGDEGTIEICFPITDHQLEVLHIGLDWRDKDYISNTLKIILDDLGIYMMEKPPIMLTLDLFDVETFQQYFSGDLWRAAAAVEHAISRRNRKMVVSSKVHGSAFYTSHDGRTLEGKRGGLPVEEDTWLKKQSSITTLFHDSSKHRKNGSSPGQKEAQNVSSEADWALSFLPRDVLTNMSKDGMDGLPLDVQNNLIAQILRKCGCAGHMATGRRALLRFVPWMREKFGRRIDMLRYKATEAVVAWFLMDQEPQSVKALRSGLVFAAKHYKLPIAVEGDVCNSFKDVTKKRGPALAVTVRVLYAAELLSVGIDPSGKNRHVSEAVRYCAGLKCMRSYATLRSVDTWRSKFTDVTDDYIVGTAYAHKGNISEEMKWMAFKTSISGKPWWDVVIKHWRGAESLHIMPANHRGDAIFKCERMSDDVGSSASITSIHRKIFAWAFEVKVEVLAPLAYYWVYLVYLVPLGSPLERLAYFSRY